MQKDKDIGCVTLDTCQDTWLTDKAVFMVAKLFDSLTSRCAEQAAGCFPGWMTV